MYIVYVYLRISQFLLWSQNVNAVTDRKNSSPSFVSFFNVILLNFERQSPLFLGNFSDRCVSQ